MTEVMMIYVTYTKGDESGLVLSFGAKIQEEPNKTYSVSYLAADDTVDIRTMTLDESGSFRIPVSVVPREQSLVVTFGFDGGSDGNRGVVEAYIMP
jgi:hypothetical protein